MKKNNQNDLIEIRLRMRQANRVLNRRLTQIETEEEKCLRLIQRSPRMDQIILKQNLLNYKHQKEKLTNLKVRINTILVQFEINNSIQNLEDKINHLNEDLTSLGLFESSSDNENKLNFYNNNLAWFKLVCMQSIKFGLNELINYFYIQIK
jgi:hypothetical protein